MRSIIETIRNIPAALALLPWLLGIICQVKSVFGSDKMKTFIQALKELVGSFIESDGIPTPPPVDNTRPPVNPKQEQERRFGRFMNRIRLFRRVPESDVQRMCEEYGITEETGVRS